MKSVFLHFKSSIPFELKINGESLGLVDNVNRRSIDIVDNSSILYVTYMPVSRECSYVPYTYIIDNSNELRVSNNNVEIIPYDGYHYDIIMSPILIENYNNEKVTYSNNIDKYGISIVSHSHSSTIVVLLDNKIIHSKNISNITNAYSDIKYNHLVIEGECRDKIYLLVIETKSNTILIDSLVDSIKENDHIMRAFVDTKDTLGHGIIHNINLKNSTIEDSLVYVDNKPKSVKQDSIIPLAFLECIKINNFKIAKTYLCDTMQNVSDSHFTEYFGKIDSIHYNTHCFKENVENYLIKTANIYKSYNFILNQGKIQDIEQVF